MNLFISEEYHIYKIEYTVEIIVAEKFSEVIGCFKQAKEHVIFMFAKKFVEQQYSEQVQEYINQRVALMSEDWFLPWERYGETEPILWVEPTSLNEINELLHKVKDVYFICCIVDENYDTNNILYILEHKEHQQFIIHEEGPKNFVTKIMPKLKELFPELECKPWEEEYY